MDQMDIDFGPMSLLQLPDTAIVEVMRNLDAKSMVCLEQTASYFHRKDPVSRLPLAEHIAKEAVMQSCSTLEHASRFR